MYYLVGLGNPGEEYEGTRHNTGRMIVLEFAKKNKFLAWVYDKKINAQKSEGKVGKGKTTLILPDTFMNNSGNAVGKIVNSKKKAGNLVVVHDDLDLPLGKFKISFAKHSAGHKGVESVIRKVKTNEFIRIRTGICPKKKPSDGKELIKFLMGKFTHKELLIFKKTSKKITSAIEMIISDGLQKAMSRYN